MSSIYGGAAMGAHKAAWQVAFVAEAAALAKEDHAQALLDLVKAFERVPHHLLVSIAKAKGYSLVIL